MIGVSGIIGLGLFVHSGEILRISGPGGALFAYGFVALVAISVMEGIAEMVGVWPISNPFVEFVRAFVDEDLAVVVGIAYWYAYAMVFQTLIVAAADLADYWGMSPTLKVLVLFIACPLLLYGINYTGVFWYGLIETIGGFVKIVFVIMGIVLMMVVNHGGKLRPIMSSLSVLI
jgi:amino acid transporter